MQAHPQGDRRAPPEARPGPARAIAHTGWLLVRSAEDGATVLGPRGANYLDEGRVEGEDPLAAFLPAASRHLLPVRLPLPAEPIARAAVRGVLSGRRRGAPGARGERGDTAEIAEEAYAER